MDMELKTLKFYDFSIEKLIDLSNLNRKEGNETVQFLAKKSNGEYEVLFLNYENKIITFTLTEYGEYLDKEYYPEKFAIL